MTPPNVEQLRSALRRAVEAVVTSLGQKQAAHAQARSAEAELLRLVLEDLAPALHALSGRLHVRALIEAAERGTRQLEGFDERRGVLLAGDASPRRDPAGRYTGRALYVLEDGSLLQLEFSGTWQKPAGSEAVVGDWSALGSSLTVSDAVKAFRLDDVLERIAKLLPTVAEANARSTEDLAARATRVQALTLLLRR